MADSVIQKNIRGTSNKTKCLECIHSCPCGYFQSDQKPYKCTPAVVTKNQKRIPGPLLDRIDIHIEVPRMDYEKLSADRVGETSESIRKRIQTARNIQLARFTKHQSANSQTTDVVCNADMYVWEIRQFCKVGEDGQRLMRSAITQLNLLARAFHRTQSVKLTRTIADLAGSEDVPAI